MTQPYRLAARDGAGHGAPLSFTFNGHRYEGIAGDTLAAALLANGVRLVARSIKYHRPRGILTAGVEEPNALVQLGRGERTLPNVKATEVELFDGLVANSVNVWPSLRLDAGAAIGALSRFMPAGFYYKTFFGSHYLWNHLFEPLIRRAGGWGKAPRAADPDYYDRMHAHCDVLVVGGGPAGLFAAVTAAAGGARVMLVDENSAFGGSLARRRVRVDGASAANWVRRCLDTLAGHDNVTLLARTAVTGYYDGNYLVALERRGHEGEASSAARSRQRLWHIRARRVILATGAHERPLVFANNDRPGVMLAGAVQAYVNRHAVLPGRRFVFLTNNDRAYESVLDCAAAGADVAAVIDTRAQPDGELVQAARDLGIPLVTGHRVVDTHGRRALRAVTTAPAAGGDGGTGQRIACDVLAVSGGYNPAVHLHSQAQGRLRFDDVAQCFRPAEAAQSSACIGACNGSFALAEVFGEARAAGLQAAADCDCPAGEAPPVPATDEYRANPPEAAWLPPDATQPGTGRKHFVDLQNDSSVADLRVAVAEGFESVEHMKRYTLTGFGTDQGKISNVNGLAILAALLDRPIGDVGTTTFRPPYTPVTFAAMGGRDRGDLFDPARLTAMHDQHVAAGAVFEDVGQWKRPWYYPRRGEDMHAAVARECAAVRSGVGVLDASTLGKIDIQGPDAAEFLNRVYTNSWDRLAVGRVRYGVMCHEDGMVFDDGTTARLADDRYLMTTTTGGAANVLDHLEEYLQTEWPALRIRLTSVTEQWSTVAIAGPHSRDVLAALAPDLDTSAAGFPFLAWRDARVAGIDARVFRISFTGELQFEINVPWHVGAALWSAVMEAGAPYGITPYGTETMHVLRAEKGFIIVGQETDGTQTPSTSVWTGSCPPTRISSAGGRSRVRTRPVPTGASSSVCCRSTVPATRPRARNSPNPAERRSRRRCRCWAT
ncbi:MAG: sarcosine oxidase subunit alpha family protein [Woeseiaceae bacterium]|nr:sarcosine oxidase subunit alpha family protein [Woeseiaceae bacterium]